MIILLPLKKYLFQNSLVSLFITKMDQHRMPTLQDNAQIVPQEQQHLTSSRVTRSRSKQQKKSGQLHTPSEFPFNRSYFLRERKEPLRYHEAGEEFDGDDDYTRRRRKLSRTKNPKNGKKKEKVEEKVEKHSPERKKPTPKKKDSPSSFSQEFDILDGPFEPLDVMIPNNDPVIPLPEAVDELDNVNLISTEHMAQDEVDLQLDQDDGYLYLLDEVLERQRLGNNSGQAFMRDYGVNERRGTPIFYSDDEDGPLNPNGQTEQTEKQNNDFSEFDDHFSL